MLYRRDGDRIVISRELTALIFDMDGVLTETAQIHAEAWKKLFDAYLWERSEKSGETFKPFTMEDYARYVDGKPRYEGAESFLLSRGIRLSFGTPDDPPELETVCGLANRKNAYFNAALEERGAKAYASSLSFVKEAKAKGARVAAITSSKNGHEILRAAGISDLFDAKITGLESAELGLKGKPDPDIFLTAAERLDAEPARAAVFEDALAGVEAARRGGFGLVVGVDRIGQADELKAKGADLVVKDLSELRFGD